VKEILNKNGIKIINDNCFDYFDYMIENNIKANVILTSPPYNSNKKAGKNLTNKISKNIGIRYDIHVDNMTTEEYAEWTINLFNYYDKLLNKDGCIIYNLSYGNENPSDWIVALNSIITKTNFMFADTVIWKKLSAYPMSLSINKLTRITEFIFIFCRKDEYLTFKTNKEYSSTRNTGQKMYKNILNFIEAKNNDGQCELNLATFSSELVMKLLKIYAQPGSLIMDNFGGTHTTAVAAYKMGYECISIELSEEQCLYGKDRLNALFFDEPLKLKNHKRKLF